MRFIAPEPLLLRSQGWTARKGHAHYSTHVGSLHRPNVRDRRATHPGDTVAGARLASPPRPPFVNTPCFKAALLCRRAGVRCCVSRTMARVVLLP